jgi:hypothetical protein
MFRAAAPQRDSVKKSRVDPYDPQLYPVFVPPKQNCTWTREREVAKQLAYREEQRCIMAKRYHKLTNELDKIESVLGPGPRSQVKSAPAPSTSSSGPPASLLGGALREVSCSATTIASAAELVHSLSGSNTGIFVAKDDEGNLILVVGPRVGGQITLTYRDNFAILSREVSGAKQTSEVKLGIGKYEAC